MSDFCTNPIRAIDGICSQQKTPDTSPRRDKNALYDGDISDVWRGLEIGLTVYLFATLVSSFLDIRLNFLKHMHDLRMTVR